MPSSQPSEQEICQRLGEIQIEIARLIEERLALRAQLDPSELEALLRGREPQGVAYLGPEHSYSHSAARKYFGDRQLLCPVGTISAVFEEVHRGQSRYGAVPIENSTDGRIVDTMFNFIKRPLQICGEVLLPIHHNLLSVSDRLSIRKVYSKPQALSQCRRWLSEHLPEAQRIEVASTTHAAKIAKQEPGAAAIASLEASLEYGLPIVCESIEDDPNNATRFAIIGKDQPAITGRDKTAILFQVPHQPGALADAMLIFRDNGINLTWIESLPVPGSPNEYYFFVEIEGHRDEAPMVDAIGALVERSLRLDVLGSYPRGIEG